MKENNFVYADLSTFDIKTAKDFYTTVFDWKYQSSGNDYHVAEFNEKVKA